MQSTGPPTFTTAIEFRIVPVEMTVLLNSPRAEFRCRTFESTHLWIVDNSALNFSQSGPHGQRGITNCFARQLRTGEFESGLCIRTTEVNNNTVVQCALPNVRSEPVTLKIQGTLKTLYRMECCWFALA